MSVERRANGSGGQGRNRTTDTRIFRRSPNHISCRVSKTYTALKTFRASVAYWRRTATEKSLTHILAIPPRNTSGAASKVVRAAEKQRLRLERRVLGCELCRSLALSLQLSCSALPIALCCQSLSAVLNLLLKAADSLLLGSERLVWLELIESHPVFKPLARLLFKTTINA